jgi:hypothetical protein
MVFFGFQATSAPNMVAITTIVSRTQNVQTIPPEQQHFSNKFNMGQFILCLSYFRGVARSGPSPLFQAFSKKVF